MSMRVGMLVLWVWMVGCEATPAADGGAGGGSSGGGGGAMVNDTTRPTVLGTTPSDGASDVSASTPVVVRFDEPMNAASLGVVASPQVSLGNPTWNTAGTEVQFNPPQALPRGTVFSVTVTGTDVVGNAMSSLVFSFTTAAAPDTTPPTVDATLPTDGATQIADTTPLVLQFSEAMQRSTLTVVASPAVTFGAPVFTNNDASVSFAPATAWTVNTTYTITVAGTDLAGNAVSPAHVFTFTTSGPSDTTPPTLTTTSPANAATGVPTNTRLTLSFSEPMDPAALIVGTTPPVALGTASFGNGAALVSYPTPAADWAPSTSYTVTVEGADLRGNPLTPTSFSFTTSSAPDTVRPFVQSTTPGASMTAVPTNAKLALVFSEPMNLTATEAAVTVSGGVTCAFSWQASDSILTCTPSAPLTPSTLFTVTVGTGAADKVGNTVATSYVFTFTTGTGADTALPTIVSTTPSTTAGAASPGTIGVPQTTRSITVRFSEVMDKASTQAAFALTAPTATNGAFTWDASGTELTYTFDAGFVLPFGTLFAFSLAATATDLAGNPLATASAGSRFFRVRRQASRALYACGTDQNCTITSPMALPGALAANALCTTVTQVSQGGGAVTVGDTTSNLSYRGFLSFDLRPLDDATAYPRLAIDRAVLSVYQESCAGTPYAANITTFMARQAVAFSVNYGAAVDASDCSITATGATSFTLPSSTASGVTKTSSITPTFTTQWNERVARSFRAQYMLRVNLESDGDSMLDLCTFASHGSPIATQRPFITVTFQFD
ncbi:MAG: Ig-like domain-containing protein [Archangium sp.]|nr:Ig-like domain-containing protein [Archangium sp.]MDP3574573.1 Ig-like domain-containing protein [Archangium sp.]